MTSKRPFSRILDNERTFIRDTDGTNLASDDGLLPIPLRVGMHITIHSYIETFEVVDWNYHWGHHDEDAGLRIVVKRL